MQFSATHDLKLAQDDLFKRLSDFEYFEKLAQEKGLNLKCTAGNSGSPAVGMSWHARTAKFRQHWSKWQALTKCSLNFLAPTSMDAAPLHWIPSRKRKRACQWTLNWSPKRFLRGCLFSH